MTVFGHNGQEICLRSEAYKSAMVTTAHTYEIIDNKPLQMTNKPVFILDELEVFEVDFTEKDSCLVSPRINNEIISVNDFQKKPSSTPVEILQSHVNEFKTLHLQSERDVLTDAQMFANELKFVAKFVRISLLREVAIAPQEWSAFENTLNEIKSIVKLFKELASSSADSNDIVYINAGGVKLTVSKATLEQAPSGSILVNMASDVWGHDLDSDGNIFQDVNSELFTAIINHLRLKALLPAYEVPPIVVNEDQRAALNNLLAFYTLSDVTVETITSEVISQSRKRKSM
jgi:hypothetical protein